MKITRDVPYTRPRVSLTSVTTGGDSGPSGHVLTSVGSNGSTAWGSNVAIITSNSSNQLTGPFVNFASGSGVSFSAASNTLTISASGGGELPWFDVKEDYGAAGDGVTDDTAEVQAAIDAAATAGGGVVYFRAGVYLIGGALTDTSRSNSQLRLPSVDAVDGEQISIHLLGEFPPPPIFSVVGATPLPDEQVVIKGTLTSVSGTSPSLLGGWGPSGSYADFTFIQLRIENLTFRLPENPVYTALNLSHVTGADLDNVICDVSDYYIQGITEPTTSTSFGIRLPAIDNGAYTRLGAVNVAGYYKGIEVGEHTQGEQVSLWGCKQAVVLIAANHASHFDRLMTVHCERGIVVTGAHYFSIDQFNIEHADAGWWITDYDIDDASNLGHGHLAWHVVLANVGPDSTFTVNGATDIYRIQIGENPFGSTIDYAEAGDLAAVGETASAGVSTEVPRADHVHTISDDAVKNAGYWDVVVSGSAPPVAVSTPSDDDWVVAWVNT